MLIPKLYEMFLYHPDRPKPIDIFNHGEYALWEQWNQFKLNYSHLVRIPQTPIGHLQNGIFFLTFFPDPESLLASARNNADKYNSLAKLFLITVCAPRNHVHSSDKSFLQNGQLNAKVIFPESLLGEHLSRAIESMQGIQFIQKDQVLDPSTNAIAPSKLIANIPAESLTTVQLELPINKNLSVSSMVSILLALLPVSRLVRHYDGGSSIHIEYDIENDRHIKLPVLNLIARISRREEDQGVSGLSVKNIVDTDVLALLGRRIVVHELRVQRLYQGSEPVDHFNTISSSSEPVTASDLEPLAELTAYEEMLAHYQGDLEYVLHQTRELRHLAALALEKLQSEYRRSFSKPRFTRRKKA